MILIGELDVWACSLDLRRIPLIRLRLNDYVPCMHLCARLVPIDSLLTSIFFLLYWRKPCFCRRVRPAVDLEILVRKGEDTSTIVVIKMVLLRQLW